MIRVEDHKLPQAGTGRNRLQIVLEHKCMFPTNYTSILDRVNSTEPIRYARTRNFIDGAVTRLSPYISRGVISTRKVLEMTLERGFEPQKIKKFIQELAWRDYWQLVWVAKGDLINGDLRNRQTGVRSRDVPKSLVGAETGIEAVDSAVTALYETGYMHNHVRMYTAAIACNVARCHWPAPAKWMYFHLLDGDWASNALSWQWVAGTNCHKKYLANQQNINRFCHTDQQGTFLDIEYAEFESSPVPGTLMATVTPDLTTKLPKTDVPVIDQGLPTYLYTLYNLDPEWHKAEKANRVLLLEPSHFERYPVSGKVIDFAIALGENIEDLQVFTGEFDELGLLTGVSAISFKEHPFNRHFRGIKESRDWMFDVHGYFPSFSSFWRKCERELSHQPALFKDHV